MPIQLAAQFNPGDLDPNVSYDQAKIVEFRMDLVDMVIFIYYEYGRTVDGKWVRGVAPRKMITIQDNPEASPPTTEFSDVVGAQVTQGRTRYEEVGIACYTYLISKGICVGTVV